MNSKLKPKLAYPKVVKLIIGGSIAVTYLEWFINNNSAKKLEDFINKTDQISNEITTINGEVSKLLQHKTVDPDMSCLLKELGENLNKTSSSTQDLMDFMVNLSGKLSDSGSNPITKMIEGFQSYLSTLSIQEVCIVINISSTIFIIACLASIIFSFYGNVIIDKLSLETRFPKLARFISLRKKFNHFYILMNISIMIPMLLLMLYVNVMTLLGN